LAAMRLLFQRGGCLAGAASAWCWISWWRVCPRVRAGRWCCAEAGVGKSALLEYLVQLASGCGIARAVGVESEMLAYGHDHVAVDGFGNVG